MLTMLLAGLATASVAAGTPVTTGTAPQASLSASREVELQGRVVCLVEATNKISAPHASRPHKHLWGFKTDDGRYYKLLRTRYSEALFADPRLREKQLILKGRLVPGAPTFDVSRIRSVRNGVVCDLYYYCSICSIKTIVPGPCMCCQQPVELVEKPLREQPSRPAAGNGQEQSPQRR
jgi:hypothetical protein